MVNVKVCGFLLCCFLVGCANRKPPAGTAQQSTSPASEPGASLASEPSDVKKEEEHVASSKPRPQQDKIDTCALITNPEIQAVQGEPVKETKSDARFAGALVMSQCFYTVATFHNSISLEVTQRDPAKPARSGPKDRWKELFHHEDEKAEKKDSGKPLKVPGIGEEAFWVGDSVSGALYVLKGDTYLRISIGGPDDRTVKVKRSKALAEKALARLRNQL
ncbi:MAG: hypothetical protein ACREBG_13910 [Pyrinomonadaceae bacterium]